MEYMIGGGLHSRLLSEGKMKETDAKVIFAQLLSAVRHLVSDMNFSTANYKRSKNLFKFLIK